MSINNEIVIVERKAFVDPITGIYLNTEHTEQSVWYVYSNDVDTPLDFNQGPIEGWCIRTVYNNLADAIKAGQKMENEYGLRFVFLKPPATHTEITITFIVPKNTTTNVVEAAKRWLASCDYTRNPSIGERDIDPEQR